jgi:hypothetical protein
MKVYFGPYKNWIGPYQVANLITKIGFSEEKADNLGEWLSNTWLDKFLNWVHKKKKRKVKVRIDDYDTWGMYETLSVIIAPMLRQLKEEKMGYPLVDNKDVPVEYRVKRPKNFYKKGFTEYDNEVENKEVAKWDWVLNEMIFAFEQYEARVLHDIDWEDQFQSGQIDMISVEKKVGDLVCFEYQHGPNHTFKIDHEGMEVYSNRIKNGFVLFGKYYLNLWD